MNHGVLRVVIFDLGGVVCQFSHHRRLAALARVSGLSTEQVHQRLFASGFDLDCDRGRYTLEEQRAEICKRLAVQCSENELAALWAEAFTPNVKTLTLVNRVRAIVRTAIFTNNGPLVDFMLRQDFSELTDRFDHVCFSYQVMATKPAPHAYLATVDRLGVAASQCVFVDDAEQNVEGARAVGMDAIRFISAQNLAMSLAERQLIDT